MFTCLVVQYVQYMAADKRNTFSSLSCLYTYYIAHFNFVPTAAAGTEKENVAHKKTRKKKVKLHELSRFLL